VKSEEWKKAKAKAKAKHYLPFTDYHLTFTKKRLRLRQESEK